MVSSLSFRLSHDGRQEMILWRDILVVVSNVQPSIEHVLEFEEVALELHRTYPGGIGMVVVINGRISPPTAAVRAEMHASLTRIGSIVRGSVSVVEGAGLRAAALRSVLMGTQLILGRRMPMHIERDIPSALAWLLPQLVGGTSRLDELEEAVQYIAHSRASHGGVLDTGT